MKFRKEILIFSLIMIFMLMSSVSAEDNITTDDGVITSDYVELDSDSGYDNVSEDSALEDSVIDDDENISEEVSEPDTSPSPVGDHDFKLIVNGAAIAGASFSKNCNVHKSSSSSHYSKGSGVDVNERSIDGMFSNFEPLEDIGFEALNDMLGEDISWETDSSCSEYLDYLKLDSLKSLIVENNMGDVFNGNIHIDLKTIDYLKYDLINFMDAGVKYVDFSIENFDVNAFLDIFDKIMNMSSTHDVMANISVSDNNPTLRNHKYYSDYSDYSFYPDADSLINQYDLDDDAELSIESDSNVSDILIIQDNMTLINQTFDLNTMPDVCIYSYDDMGSDLQSSEDRGCWRDANDNSDATVGIQSFRFSQPIDCLSSNITEDIQHTFYHMIGCECTNTSFTKQYASYDNLPEVSEFDTVTSTEEDNHDCVLFKKYNVNAPFIVENTSVFALFGVIKITIP